MRFVGFFGWSIWGWPDNDDTDDSTLKHTFSRFDSELNIFGKISILTSSVSDDSDKES